MVRFGDRGSLVKHIQVFLQKDFIDVTPDGIFGTKTLIAVQAFQKTNALTVDGLIGPATINALKARGMVDRDFSLDINQIEAINTEMGDAKQMLSSDEVIKLAAKLNNYINVPFIGEATEQVILVKMVKVIDRALYQLLPNEYYKLVKSFADGIDSVDAEKIRDFLAEKLKSIANNALSMMGLPFAFLGKLISDYAIDLLLAWITKALIKGNAIA